MRSWVNLVLAVLKSCLDAPGGAQGAKEADLSMKEVQRHVRMRAGSTVVLSACNTGRGKITAEGVIGLARAFLFVCVAAIVVSLWSVSAASRHAAPCAHHTSHICES